jgi:molecular chaperone GrpE
MSGKEKEEPREEEAKNESEATDQKAEEGQKKEEVVENKESNSKADSEENEQGDSTDSNEPKTIEEEYGELKDKYLRLYSDFDNFRKRTMKEKVDIINSASGTVIKDVLTVLDDFERAIENNENSEDIKQIKEGFKLIHTKLMNTLKAKGLEWMDAKGEMFDSEQHEAITQIPVEKKKDKGKVMDVVERGYNLNGKPLRYAKVVVGQ